jgi:hypothetical protein
MGRYRYRTTVADRVSIQDHFMSKVLISDAGHWIWTGKPRKDGYGTFYWPLFEGRKQRLAHRVSYELFRRPLASPKEVIDHLCRTPSCVNPDHLDPCAQKVNILRGVGASASHALKTHCPEGHPYDKIEITAKRKTRRCMTCRNAAKRARWMARREELMPKRRAAYAAKVGKLVS